MPDVIYKPTPRLPDNFYRVGNDGSVWSCQKKGLGAGKIGSWRQLKPCLSGKGYMAVRVGFDGSIKQIYIHHLILEAFVGPCPKGMECCHGLGGPADNRLENLRWGTHGENIKDKLLTGTQPMGSGIYCSKLREADIPVIRARCANGETFTLLASECRVDPETIRSAYLRKTWKHVA